jgi:hypothetical protein
MTEYAKSVAWWTRISIVREAVRIPVLPFGQPKGDGTSDYLSKEARKTTILSSYRHYFKISDKTICSVARGG